MRRLRVELAILLFLFTVGVTTRAALAQPQPVDLASAVNYQHWVATGKWLSGDHALDVYAQALAVRMADAGFLAHSTVSVLLGCQWGVVGENIGKGPTVDVIVTAFMASPPHALNIISDFTHVGVGLVERNGSLWVAAIFAK